MITKTEILSVDRLLEGVQSEPDPFNHGIKIFNVRFWVIYRENGAQTTLTYVVGHRDEIFMKILGKKQDKNIVKCAAAVATSQICRCMQIPNTSKEFDSIFAKCERIFKTGRIPSNIKRLAETLANECVLAHDTYVKDLLYNLKMYMETLAKNGGTEDQILQIWRMLTVEQVMKS